MPVPIDALLAPVPVFPGSEVVAAMFAVWLEEGFCAALIAVWVQALLAEGEVCANAGTERTTPIANDADKTNRDMVSSKN